MTREDAISRQAAIDAIEKTKAAMTTDGEIYVAKINAEMNIQQLPSVSTEKTGRWQHYEGMLICSECGAEFYDDIMEYCGDDVPKCCPDCGAKMGVKE